MPLSLHIYDVVACLVLFAGRVIAFCDDTTITDLTFRLPGTPKTAYQLSPPSSESAMALATASLMSRSRPHSLCVLNDFASSTFHASEVIRRCDR